MTSRIKGKHLQIRNIFNFAWTLLVLICLASLYQPTAHGRENQAKPTTKAAVAEKKGDLQELRGQIEALKKEKAKTEGKRANVADQLKTTEKEISATHRELQTLTKQHDTLQATLKNLGAQSRELENQLNEQHSQLEKLVYRQYVRGNPDALRLLLNGDNPNQLARDLHYLSSIGRARSQLVHDIDSTLRRKQALAANTRDRAADLAAVEDKQKAQHRKLLAQHEQRKQILENISAKISEQRRQIGNLQRDEKRLSQLISQLAAKAAREAAKKKKAKRVATKQTSEKSSTREINNDATPEAMPSGSFARLKGRLHLPVRGAVTNRFGGARQEGSFWKGLFIRASTGSEIKAIATGRVVFADWMRGFGNLLIIDHGDSYLTIYGNNESLLKQVGDKVQGGDNVASAGNSGGNPESGLYFELRFRGQPLDPLKWVNLK